MGADETPKDPTMVEYPIVTTAIVSDAPKDGHVQWRKESVKLREPLADEILVQIVASGICHTDVALSLLPEDTPNYAPYPKIMGHEGSGVVERVGSGVTHVKAGDKVLLSFDFCGKDGCRGCVDETPGYCDVFHSKNLFCVPDVYQTEGGKSTSGLFFGQSSFSKLALVKGTSAVNVEGLVKSEEELKLFAPLGCGYQTGAGAVTEFANVGKHDEIAVSSTIATRGRYLVLLTRNPRSLDSVVSAWRLSWYVRVESKSAD